MTCVLHKFNNLNIFLKILFIFSGDDDEEERPVTGLVQTGELFGEKPENMISLPIIKQEEQQVMTYYM